MAITSMPVIGEINGIPVINVDNLHYRIAIKTKSIKAKPMNQIISDPKGFEILLLNTLEGLQKPKSNSMVCVGLDVNDPWQQDQEKLFKNYKVVGVDSNGWLMCDPNPDAEREAVKITGIDKFAIVANWGTEVLLNDKKVYVQYGVDGDYVLRATPGETDDVYINKLFEATYSWK